MTNSVQYANREMTPIYIQPSPKNLPVNCDHFKDFDLQLCIWGGGWEGGFCSDGEGGFCTEGVFWTSSHLHKWQEPFIVQNPFPSSNFLKVIDVKEEKEGIADY